MSKTVWNLAVRTLDGDPDLPRSSTRRHDRRRARYAGKAEARRFLTRTPVRD
jgi:hypothetical protein